MQHGEEPLSEDADPGKVQQQDDSRAILTKEEEEAWEEQVWGSPYGHDPTLLGPLFGANGKDEVTVRHLLLHNAGFPPDPQPNYW